jgi:hypothetical protein
MDGSMEPHRKNSANRKGQFLWMEPEAQYLYLTTLKERISQGYYFTDRVFSRVVEDIAPILEETAVGD